MARILCVDDDRTANELKRTVLKQAGHQVDLSISAETAVARLSAAPYDALITDWRLGDESARRVIQTARLASEMLIVVVSGFIAEAFQSYGPVADLYLDKPLDPAEFVMIIDTLLKEKQNQICGT